MDGKSLESTFRRLHIMERNWQRGTPVRVHRLTKKGPQVHFGEVKSSKIVDHGRLLLTASVDGTVNVFDLKKLNKEPSKTPAMHCSKSKEDMSNVPASIGDDSFIPSQYLSLGTPRARSIEPKAFVTRLLISEDISCIDFERYDENNAYIAVSSYDGSVACQIHCLETSKHYPSGYNASAVAYYQPPKWVGAQCLCLSGDMVALGAYNGMVHIWNWRKDQLVGIIDWLEKNPVAGVKIYPKGKHAQSDMLMMVSTNGTISMFRLPSEYRQGKETKAIPIRILRTDIVQSNTVISALFSDIIPIPDDFSIRLTVATPGNHTYMLTFARLAKFCMPDYNEPMQIMCPVSDVLEIYGFRVLASGAGATATRCAFAFGITSFQNWLALYTAPSQSPKKTSVDDGSSQVVRGIIVPSRQGFTIQRPNLRPDDLAVFYLATTSNSSNVLPSSSLNATAIPTLNASQTAFPFQDRSASTFLKPTIIPRSQMPLGMGIASPLHGHILPVDVEDISAQMSVSPTSQPRDRLPSSVAIGGWAESLVSIGTSSGHVWVLDFDPGDV